MLKEQKAFLTKDEVAGLLGYSASYFNGIWEEYCNKNKIRYTRKNPRRVLINAKDIQTHLKRRK